MLANLLLGSVIRGALGVRRKPFGRTAGFLTGGSPFLNLGTLIGAAGVAWGTYEHFKNRAPTSTTTVDGGFGPPGPPPSPSDSPPPLPPSFAPASGDVATTAPAEGEGEALRRLTALTISAARADGDLSEEEYGRILQVARENGADELVLEELENPRPLARIVAGANDLKLKRDLYVLAFSIVRADQDVSGAERVWLAQLAGLLGLDAATTARLEKETAERIDRTGA